MNILALDPAARTGWALGPVKDRVDESGVWLLGTDADARPARLAEYLRLAIQRFKPEVIAYEAATFGSRNPHVMRRHNELVGALRTVCVEAGLPCWEFGIGTWKARTLGSGRADKPAVIRGLRTYFGLEVAQQDEADAIGVLFAAQVGPPPEAKRKQVSRARRSAKKLPRLF